MAKVLFVHTLQVLGLGGVGSSSEGWQLEDDVFVVYGREEINSPMWH